MVKQIQQMGEDGSSIMMRKIDSKLMKIYRIFPFTYIGMVRNSFGRLLNTRNKVTMLDLGCGDGTMMQNLGLPNNFEITGVDLFDPYLKLAKKKKIYKELIKSDIRKYKSDKKFNVVIASHVLEHLSKEDGATLLKKIDGIAKDKIVFIIPVGNSPQDGYDGNRYQLHKSAWYPNELKGKGYSVFGQGFKLIFRQENTIKRYKLFAYFIFLLSMLFQPFLFFKPEWAVYMICVKEINV